jgi:hypothetical protein
MQAPAGITSVKHFTVAWIAFKMSNDSDMSMPQERPIPLTELFGDSPSTRPSASLPKAAAPVGCNNGCCDYQWLATLTDCKKYWDFNWFNYNYDLSKVNTSTSQALHTYCGNVSY